MRLTTMRDYSEKRDFIRMKVDTQIELASEDGSKRLKGVCKDLSGTGMSIEVSEPFEMGTIFLTSLPSNNEAFPPFETQVKVIRCSQLSEESYMLGVEIAQLSK